MAKRLIIANWKMNPATLKEARALFQATKKKASTVARASVVIAPPSVYLAFCKPSKKVLVGAQNVAWADKGAFTGEISAVQLANLNVTYVIVGHSERRFLGETDEIISKKIKSVLKQSLIPVLCIGELERDNHGAYLRMVEDQIRKSLAGIGRESLAKVVIAYEPVWAIGKSSDEAVNSHKLHEMTIFIRKILSGMCGRDLAHKVQIIYGGSVEAKNALELIQNGNVSGFLVGHASLDIKGFGEIIKAVDARG